MKFEITTFDFNDVFSKEEHEFPNEEWARLYVESQIKPEHRKDFEWMGSDPDSYVCYYPTDPDDDFDELRIELGFTVESIE